MSHYFLVCAVIIQLLSVTLGHRIADPVTGWSPTIQVYIQPINTTTSSIFSQLDTALATEWHRSMMMYGLA